MTSLKSLYNLFFRIELMRLSEACKRGFVKEAKKQIELLGGKQSGSLTTALKHAVAYSKVEIVKLLLENGATVSEGNHELDLACSNGNTEIIKLLLATGARVPYTSIMIACGRTNADTIKLLVEHGVDIFVYGNNIITRAEKHGYANVIDYLHKLLLIKNLKELV